MDNSLEEYYKNLKDQTNDQLPLYLFCCSISVIWIIYVLFFNSRIVGIICTFFLNLYLKKYSKIVWIRIRSLSISFLSGKIMFRGVHYVTVDYMLYIQDGWISFAYWKPQFVNEKKTQTNQAIPLKKTARLNIFLCNFQLHYYNSWKLETEPAPVIKKRSSRPADLNTNNRFNLRNFSINKLINHMCNRNVNLDDSADVELNGYKRTKSEGNEMANDNLASDGHDISEDLMQLFSVVNIRIQKGRLFAGNMTLPSMFSVRLSNAKMELVTEKSQSLLDEYCFILRGELSKLEVNLIPNKKFQPLDLQKSFNDKKSENRVLFFRSVASDFQYIQDVPSILTFDKRHLVKSESGELIQNEKEPQWSLVLNCNKQTILNYGPWFDRQREALWGFFFPAIYGTAEPQPEPTLNERRQTSKFDFTLNTNDPSTEINVLFTKLTSIDHFSAPTNETNTKHEFKKISESNERKIAIKCKSRSSIVCSFPWLTKHYGYKTTVDAVLNSVECTTNLSFKHFLNAETARLAVDINYPLRWNDLQVWNINMDLDKSDIYFTFYHKYFFQQLINDWSSRYMADLRKFVPYIYDIKLKANDLEIILPCNQYNWIDVNILENNAFFEVLAKNAKLDIAFGFEDFLPNEMKIPMDVTITEACARFFVPPTSMSLALLKILRKKLKYVTIDNGIQNEFVRKRWSRFNRTNKTELTEKTAPPVGEQDALTTDDLHLNTETYLNNNEKPVTHSFKTSFSSKPSKSAKPKQESTKNKKNSKPDENTKNRKNQSNQAQNESQFDFSENWFECWQADYARIIMNYEYHPCPVLDWNQKKLNSVNYLNGLDSPNFNCEIFKPDLIDLSIEIGPSLILLYGTFLKRLWFIKECFLSWDQMYTDVVCDPSIKESNLHKSDMEPKAKRNVSKPYVDTPVHLDCDRNDPRSFRPLSVKVVLAIHNINAHLMMDLEDNIDNLPIPIGFTDRLALELEKNYNETILQLYFDPVNLFMVDTLSRPFDKNICQGHLCLSSVQLRGHAMFSDEGRLKTDSLEYAWLLEILLGDITGSINPVQTQQIVHCLETMLTLIMEKEYSLEPVFLNRVDPSMPWKYEVTRFSIDLVDIYMIESGTALNINIFPVRLSICNSHTKEYAKGLSACAKTVRLKLFVNEASRADETASSSLSSKPLYKKRHSSTRFNASRTSLKLSSNHASECLLNSNGSINDVISNSSVSLSSLESNSSASSLESSTLKKKRFPDSNISGRNQLKKTKQLDSNEFNYWFECFSFATGQINLDLALDKGDPIGQIEFLRIHDRRKKNLYFLWLASEDSESKNHVYDRIKLKSEKLTTYRCGCFGGCFFYSVFEEKYSRRRNKITGLGTDDEFFNLNKSITRGNENFALSYFVPEKKILESHPAMVTKYLSRMYTFKLSSLHPADDSFSLGANETSISSSCSLSSETASIRSKPKSTKSSSIKSTSNKPSATNYTSQSSLNKPSSSTTTVRHIRVKSDQVNGTAFKDLIIDTKSSPFAQFDTLKIGNLSKSISSLSNSSSNTVKLNDDDYYTADEEEEEVYDETMGSKIRLKKYEKNPALKKRSITRFSHKSVNSLKSKNSFVSVKENDLKSVNSKVSIPDTNPFVLPSLNINESRPNKLDLLSPTATLTSAGATVVDDYVEPDGHDQSSQIETEMTLKFDIQRPILDSILPKYFYLKYLSRAYAQNWNQVLAYPYYDDHKPKNINFDYRQKGFDCSYVSSRSVNNVKPNLVGNSFEDFFAPNQDTANEATANQATLDEEDEEELKCKINLKFTHNIECYITPLSLTAVERSIKSIKSYKTSASHLITQLQSKSESHFASNSLKDAISKTQVSMHIPQIMVCSLQCGLSEGDKVSNAFSHTLNNPEEFMALSLFTLCVHSVQTQLIDSQNKTAAIFMIDKIESQFCRLFENESLEKPIKLSCIADKHSKTSIRCFKDNELLDENDRFKRIQNSIMYECAFERINIKAVKKLNAEIDQPVASPNLNDPKLQQQQHSRLSLSEFEISKIWFSFPEPPISPKGKRKIPYTRNDWNLLSSVSPAVSSWLCASKHCLKPLKEYLDSTNRHTISVMAALISGSHKTREKLESELEKCNHMNPMNKIDETIFGRKAAKSVTKQQLKEQQQINVNHLIFKKMLADFVASYLTTSASSLLNDPNIILVNLIRNYALFYNGQLTVDLNSSHIPDEKFLKKAVSEELNSWSSIILDCIEQKSTSSTNNVPIKRSQNDRVILNMNENHYIKGTNDSSYNQTPVVQPQSDQNSEDAMSLDIELNKLNMQNNSPFLINENQLAYNLIRENQTTSNDEEITEKNQAELKEEEIYKKTSKVFKPFLSFIGVDAPTGKLIDNLFNEMGSFLLGTLKIKSVDINILGKQTRSVNDSFNEAKLRPARKSFTNGQLLKSSEPEYSKQGIEMEKVITTILSFDSLLINLNIRKILNETPSLNTNTSSTPVIPESQTNKFSIVNPVYATMNKINDINDPKQQQQKLVKYTAKIDANMQLNNLTQEVNMPLLRLVHQIYSIIADAIDYDKEQAKSARNIQADDTLESNLNQAGNQFNDAKTPTSMRAKLSQYQGCWKELVEKINNPKCFEKDEVNGKQNSQNSKAKTLARTRNILSHDGMTLSLFGWMFIKRINSRATLGTLAFNGEMNNIQLSSTFGPKTSGVSNSKKRYEGSVNACVDSTYCKLTENETQQNVVQMSIARCHLFCLLKKFQIKNSVSSFVHIGQIHIDVPLRPMLIHGVVYRESKVIEQNILPEIKNFVIFETAEISNVSLNDSTDNNTSKLNNLMNTNQDGDKTLRPQTHPADSDRTQSNDNAEKLTDYKHKHKSKRQSMTKSSFLNRKNQDKYILMNKNRRVNEFIFELKSKLDGCEIRAKLLENPCLKAAYLINNIECNAIVSNDCSKLSCSMDSHCLSFQCDDYEHNPTPKMAPKNPLAYEMMTMNPLEERTNFYLPSVCVMGTFNYNQTDLFDSKIKKENSLAKKSMSLNTKEIKHINSIDFHFKVAPLSRELNAEVIAQLVFVTKVFIKEINNILQAVYSSDTDSEKVNHLFNETKENSFHKHLFQTSNTSTYFYYDLKVDVGKISLTGLTPTNTSLTIYTGDHSVLNLTNSHGSTIMNEDQSSLGNGSEYSLRPLIEAKCNISIELKTSLKLQKPTVDENSESSTSRGGNILNVKNGDSFKKSPETDSSDWFQLAYFNTKFDLKNENSIKQFNIEPDRESITVTVEKPRFYLQPGAVDSAILFWLNYKSTYEFWLQQRQEFSSFLIDQHLSEMKTMKTFNKHSPLPPSNPYANTNNDHSSRDTVVSNNVQTTSDIHNNLLALKLRVTGLGLALPLSNAIKKDIFKSNIDCLVISLNDTSFYACNSVGCVVTKGQFENFCLRFAESFNLNSTEWSPACMTAVDKQIPVNMASRSPMNAWVVPFGSYEVCSSTIEKEKLIETLSKQSPIWILSVKWKMEGIEVNFDTSIGKWLSKLADTVTRLAETQTNNETINIDEDSDLKKKHLTNYPEKAKQMILKTRNNLRDQLGFKNINNINNQKSTTLTGVTNPAKKNLANEVASRNLLPSLISPSQKKAFKPANHTFVSRPSYHLRSKSGDFSNLKKSNRSNDDFSLSYSSYKPNEFETKPVFRSKQFNYPIEENDTDENIAHKLLQTNHSLDNPNYELVGNNFSSPQQQHQMANPTSSAIDFKLEIKIEISSGKCILHASKIPGKDEYSNHLSPGDIYGMDYNYPMSNNRHTNMRSEFTNDADIRNTNFIFPAIKVKAFYESSHKTIENRLSKKANLYAMIRLESFVMPIYPKDFSKKEMIVSRHMCISPALLDFLEQTLEPLDTLRNSFESSSLITTPLANRLSKDQQSTLKSQKENIKPNEMIHEKLLEDTPIRKNVSGEIKQIEVQPKNAEGPAYFPIEVVAFVSMQPSSIRFICLPQSTMECLLRLPTLEMVFSTYKSMDSTLKENIYNQLNSENKENIEKQNGQSSKALVKNSEKGGLSVTCSMTDFSLKFYNRLAIIKHNADPKDFRYEHSPFSDDKDSLSINVAYIKINISRSRKISTKEVDDPFLRKHDFSSSRLSFHQNTITYNDVELSVLADIGSSSFIYDMRNIKEVFIFPKIWYRRSLARRLFLGEESSSMPAFKSTTSNSNLNNNSNSIHLNTSTGFLFRNDFKSGSTSSLNDLKRPKSLNLNLEESLYCVNTKWKTLVLISVNLADFEVKMNIGNVMGNVSLYARNAKTKSRISISNFGKKCMLFNFILDSCRIIAEGGSNACCFRIQDITSAVEINDQDEKGNPSHKIDFGILATECRVDSAYNSQTPILSFRLSSFNLKLNDQWDDKLPEALLELNVVWDQLHLMITKATTPDLIKMYYKLIDFFEKQLNEGKDYIKDFDIFYDPKIKQQFTEKLEPVMKRNFGVNGGSIQLKGNNFTLITFHGNNFKAKQWAVFSLNEPSLDFACQQYIKNNATTIEQTLGFYLGRYQKKSDMASIYKVYNDSAIPFTRFETINEWFEYAHTGIDAVGLRDFPTFKSDETNRSSKKKKEDVRVEEIFHLPSLQVMCFSTQENNTVNFEFTTEFHDHILLTFRTELFGFLHELITSYIREKDIYQGKEPYIPETKIDIRDYDCKKWDLNPTLRLISKFGGAVDPPKVDNLLKSLGFTYAQKTIPKWFQRGLLDSLNDLMFQLIKFYLKILSDQDLKLKTSTNKYDE